MSSEISRFIQILNRDSNNWGIVGKIQEKQKLEIQLDSKGETDSVAISYGESGSKSQAISRMINKTLFGTIADADSTVKVLQSSRANTLKHIEDLINTVHLEKEADPLILEEALRSLSTLKESLETVTNEGYDNLKKTYAGRVSKEGKTISEILEAEQGNIHREVIDSISSAIVDIGAKILERKVQQNVELQRSSASSNTDLIVQSFVFLEEEKEVEEEEIQPQPSMEPDSLLDLDAAEKWEAKKAYLNRPEDEGEKEKEKGIEKPADSGGWIKSFQKSLLDEPEVTDSLKSFQHYLKGEGTAIQLHTMHHKEESVDVPEQFSLDLPRMRLLQVNGQTAYSNTQTFKYNPVDGYKQIRQAFRKVDPLNGDLLAERTARLVNQTSMGPLTKKMMILTSTDEVLMNVDGKTQMYQIDVKDDRVYVTMKVSFELSDHTNPEEKLGAIIAKRVLEIPLDELKAEDLEQQESPIPNATVTDIFSHRIFSRVYADELLTTF